MLNFRRASLLLFAMTFLLMMLVGCLSHPPPSPSEMVSDLEKPTQTRTPYRVVIDDVGVVCAYATTANEFKITITPGKYVCLSSSCTRVNERAGNIRIDSEKYEIRLTSHFDAEERLDVSVCTEDCGGAGKIELDSVTIADGLYTIWLGAHFLGMIVVPAEENSYQCFETSETPTPTRTPFTPTATPTNTPTPPAFLSPLVTPISPLPTPTSDS